MGDVGAVLLVLSRCLGWRSKKSSCDLIVGARAAPLYE